MTQFVSTHFRHHDIRNNHVRHIFLDYFECLFAIAAYLYVIVVRQCIAEIFPQLIIILHNQDLRKITVLLLFLFSCIISNVWRNILRHSRFSISYFLTSRFRTVNSFSIRFFTFWECDFNTGAFSFRACKVDFAFMQVNKFPYQ